ncbi:hypothetical protein D3C87_930280 [compost metagenome]
MQVLRDESTAGASRSADGHGNPGITNLVGSKLLGQLHVPLTGGNGHGKASHACTGVLLEFLFHMYCRGGLGSVSIDRHSLLRHQSLGALLASNGGTDLVRLRLQIGKLGQLLVTQGSATGFEIGQCFDLGDDFATLAAEGFDSFHRVVSFGYKKSP